MERSGDQLSDLLLRQTRAIQCHRDSVVAASATMLWNLARDMQALKKNTSLITLFESLMSGDIVTVITF